MIHLIYFGFIFKNIFKMAVYDGLVVTKHLQNVTKTHKLLVFKGHTVQFSHMINTAHD